MSQRGGIARGANSPRSGAPFYCCGNFAGQFRIHVSGIAVSRPVVRPAEQKRPRVGAAFCVPYSAFCLPAFHSPARFALAAASPSSIIAAAAPVTAATAAAPPTAAARESTFRLRTGLVHDERATFHLMLV